MSLEHSAVLQDEDEQHRSNQQRYEEQEADCAVSSCGSVLVAELEGSVYGWSYQAACCGRHCVVGVGVPEVVLHRHVGEVPCSCTALVGGIPDEHEWASKQGCVLCVGNWAGGCAYQVSQEDDAARVVGIDAHVGGLCGAVHGDIVGVVTSVVYIGLETHVPGAVAVQGGSVEIDCVAVVPETLYGFNGVIECLIGAACYPVEGFIRVGACDVQASYCGSHAGDDQGDGNYAYDKKADEPNNWVFHVVMESIWGI